MAFLLPILGAVGAGIAEAAAAAAPVVAAGVAGAAAGAVLNKAEEIPVVGGLVADAGDKALQSQGIKAQRKKRHADPEGYSADRDGLAALIEDEEEEREKPGLKWAHGEIPFEDLPDVFGKPYGGSGYGESDKAKRPKTKPKRGKKRRDNAVDDDPSRINPAQRIRTNAHDRPRYADDRPKLRGRPMDTEVVEPMMEPEPRQAMDINRYAVEDLIDDEVPDHLLPDAPAAPVRTYDSNGRSPFQEMWERKYRKLHRRMRSKNYRMRRYRAARRLTSLRVGVARPRGVRSLRNYRQERQWLDGARGWRSGWPDRHGFYQTRLSSVYD